MQPPERWALVFGYGYGVIDADETPAASREQRRSAG
jgi:hypothetical protein